MPTKKPQYCAMHKFLMKTSQVKPCLRCGNGTCSKLRICNWCGANKIRQKQRYHNVIKPFNTACQRLKNIDYLLIYKKCISRESEVCYTYSKDSSILWSGVVQRYICSYVFFYITTGYVCTNIYISGSKPLFCIYIPPTSQYFNISLSLARAECYALLYWAVFPGLHFLNIISAYAYLIVKIVIKDALIS